MSTLDLTIPQGATFLHAFAVQNADGSPFDLSDWTAASQLRAAAEAANVLAEMTATVTDGPLGLLALSLTAAETAALTAGLAVYDIKITNTGTGQVLRPLQGLAVIDAQVTR